MSFDGRTVVVTKKGRGQARVPLDGIQSISIERAGIGMRGIRFAVAGGTVAGPRKALGSHADLAQDPYALTFRTKHEPQFAALIDEIERARS